jgi:ubiquinone/menaquinone biosynthesis C-methylase UbiE
MDRATVDVYEHRAEEWSAKRAAVHRARAVELAGRALPGLVVADLGCGPGHYLGDLGPAVVGLDAAAAMLAVARREHGRAATALVQADLEALPVRDRSLGGAWASNSYLHVPRPGSRWPWPACTGPWPSAPH